MVAFALLGLVDAFRDTAKGEYAKLGAVMQIGPVGGAALAAIVIGFGSWMLVFGIQMFGGKLPPRWFSAAPMLLILVISGPSHLAQKPRNEVWTTLSMYAILTAAMLAAKYLTRNPSLPKAKNPNGQP